MANGFSQSFEKAYNISSQKSSDATLEAIKEKIKLDTDKATKKLEATTINSAILMQAAQSGDKGELEKAQTIIDAIGDTQPDASKLVYSSIQQRIKDKTDFQQALQTEGVKARMLGVNDVIKTLADKGGYSLSQLQEIGDAAYQNANIPIGERIVNASNQSKSGILDTPIPAKKSDRQIDQEDAEKRGLSILDQTEAMYNDISEKYGTGRLKGIATQVRGGLGDLIPGSERAPEVVPYRNNLEGLANFIGKTVYRDERVSDVNIKGYKKALAELTNTPEEAKIMFATLRSFATEKDPKALQALRLMIPKDGNGGMKPSQALKKVDSANSAQEEADAYLNG